VGVELARLVIIAVLAAALPALLATQSAAPAAAPIIEPEPAELLLGPPPPDSAEITTPHPHPIDPAATGSSVDAARPADPTGGWFDERELKLSAVGDKSDMFVDPNACVYPDSYLRTLGGGRDDCGVLKPGTDDSEMLTLPFLALLGWVLVIGAVAALNHFHRNWRVRRWLRRMRAQGLAPSATESPPLPRRRARRSSSRHGRAGSRRYAGEAVYTTDK